MPTDPHPMFAAMLAPDEALLLVVETAAPLPSREVPLVDACGLELAESIVADRDYPPFPRAMMDGYAVCTGDAGRSVPVCGEIPAGHAADEALTAGRCFEIMTGAPCPSGTEAVVPKENVRHDGGGVRLPRQLTPGQHVAPQGSECRSGQVLLGLGDTITPLAVAVMASFGLRHVRVTPKPQLGIITTGAELVSPEARLTPGQIRDSNGPMLSVMARDLAVEVPVHLHADDQLDSLLETLEQVSGREIVLLTGGVSVGTYDLVPQALREYGAEIVFHKVRQKPGKPMLFARKGSQLIFGLPGNPLASHFCFHRYVTAAIRKMSGKRPAPEAVPGELAGPVRPKRGRTYFMVADARRAAHDEPWRIHPAPGVSSADVYNSCRGNCYVEVPPGATELDAGEILAFSWIGGAPWPH